jgi:hypothetical protein
MDKKRVRSRVNAAARGNATIDRLRNNLAPQGRELNLILSNSALRLGATGRRNGLYAVAQSSKIIERLNFHRICRFGNFDDEDLVLVLFHSLMNVCEMNEVIFRDQGIGSIFVVDGDRPSRAHCNSPKLPDALS